MTYVRSDDRVRIYYEQHGSKGSPVVLAYGLGGTTEQWDVNIPALAARHRVFLWEPRGHGRSGSPEDPSSYSFARWADDLRAVLDHIRIRRAHVGGLSLGGGIATHFTLLHPSRVLSLLITSSASAAGRPLSVDDLVMRATSVKVAIEQGMDALAEFAMAQNPNYRARLTLDPSLKMRSARSTGGSPQLATRTQFER
jgi:pimeloyl-ACP methyl ester carboxylesterase